MRTTRELINELGQEALLFTGIALVVGFEDNAKFVFYQEDEDACLKELNFLINKGGEPIGMVAYTQEHRNLKVTCRLLQEYQTEEWAKDYLKNLAASFQESLLTVPKQK
jgi:hypothetical protein